jgi:hypothetical protein
MYLFQTEAAAKTQVKRLKKRGNSNAYYTRYHGSGTAQMSGRPAKWVAYSG